MIYFQHIMGKSTIAGGMFSGAFDREFDKPGSGVSGTRSITRGVGLNFFSSTVFFAKYAAGFAIALFEEGE